MNTYRVYVGRPAHQAWTQLLATGEIPDRGVQTGDLDDPAGVLHVVPEDARAGHEADLTLATQRIPAGD